MWSSLQLKGWSPPLVHFCFLQFLVKWWWIYIVTRVGRSLCGNIVLCSWNLTLSIGFWALSISFCRNNWEMLIIFFLWLFLFFLVGVWHLFYKGYPKSQIDINWLELKHYKNCLYKMTYGYLIFSITSRTSLNTVRQWSRRPGFNPRSCHTKDFKNGTW